MKNKTQTGFSLFEGLLALFLAGLLINIATYYATKNYRIAHSAYQQNKLLNVISCYLQNQSDKGDVSLSVCADLLGAPLSGVDIKQSNHQLVLHWLSALPISVNCKTDIHHSCLRILL